MSPPAVLPLSIDPLHALRQVLVGGLQSGRWAPGERLPTERELCERYGIGRSALRRLLGELKALGLIEQTVGSGTYAARDLHQKLPAAMHVASVVSPAELMEARLLIEPLMVDLIVAKATAADFEAMENCCREAENAATHEEFEHWDGALHQQLAAATHNTFFIQIMELATQARDRGEWGLLKKKSVTPQARLRLQDEHRMLVRALKSRDAEAARLLLTDHLRQVSFSLFGRPPGL